MTAPHRPVFVRRSLSLVTACALSWASVAAAAPAVIKHGTDARSAPFNVAPLVGDLSAGTKLEADVSAKDGWRRVQLPNGKFAFVHDADIEVDVSQAPPPPAAQPAATPSAEAPAPVAEAATPARVEPLSAPRGAAPLYVSDFSHLAQLVKADPRAFDLASTYESEETFSSVAIWGGVFGGLLLWVLADTALAKNTCVAPSVCEKTENSTVHSIGTGLLVLGPLIGWAVRPTKSDLTRVLDAWNANHPDRPFIDRAGVEAPQ